MAKLKGPLFSLSASQALAKTLVYFTWKGLNVVRQYVVPANPQTAPQVTQRGYLTAAVALIHTAQARATNPLNGEDVSAYALLGGTLPTPRTWFNQAVKEMVDAAVAGVTPAVFYDGHATPGVDQLTIDLYEHYVGQTNGSWYWGTSKTALINHQAANIAGAHIDGVIAALVTGVKYFVQYRPDVGDPSEGCNSGIYYGTPT